MLFSFAWTTLVYCPLAYWIWDPRGWAFKWGVLDFSGGGPVEIGSGVGGFACAFVLGRRKESQLVNFRCTSLRFLLFQDAHRQLLICSSRVSLTIALRVDSFEAGYTMSPSSLLGLSSSGLAGLGSMPYQRSGPTSVPFMPRGTRPFALQP